MEKTGNYDPKQSADPKTGRVRAFENPRFSFEIIVLIIRGMPTRLAALPREMLLHFGFMI